MQELSYKDNHEIPFIELQSVDSTNNYARTIINQYNLPDSQQPGQNGITIFSHEQTAGKGQRGKKWVSEKDNNIAISLLIRPHPLTPSKQFQLNVCTAVSVFDFFVKYAIENVKIKWPNDLYWQDRKAGGILIESVMKSGNENVATWEWAIIGTGININQQVFSAELPNPVSLRQITGKQYNVVKLAKELSSLIYQNFKQLVATGFGPYYEKYNEHLYKRNQIVKLKKDNRVFEALIKGVTETGDLKVQHAIEEDFGFGKVEWVH